MAKIKKTKKEKKLSDNRRQTTASDSVQPLSYIIAKSASMPVAATYHVNQNQLIIKDLRKTLILTVIALAIQIGIYVLMHSGRG